MHCTSASRSQFKNTFTMNPCQLLSEDVIVLLNIAAEFFGKDRITHYEVIKEGKAISQPRLKAQHLVTINEIKEVALFDDPNIGF